MKRIIAFCLIAYALTISSNSFCMLARTTTITHFRRAYILQRPFHWHTPIPTDPEGYAKHQKELNQWKNRWLEIEMNRTKDILHRKCLKKALRKIEVEDENLLRLDLLKLEAKSTEHSFLKKEKGHANE